MKSVKQQLLIVGKELENPEFRTRLFKEIKLEIKDYLFRFSNEFQAKYQDVAKYYLDSYSMNLDAESVKVLNSIIKRDIFHAFEFEDTPNGLNVNINKDLLFFIGALEYGTKQIIADKSIQELKDKIIGIAQQKLHSIISEVINDNVKALSSKGEMMGLEFPKT
jgi:CO dehydrogenase/acetyl-CoA synthase epsilon subunit